MTPAKPPTPLALQQQAWAAAAKAGDKNAAARLIESVQGTIWQHIGRACRGGLRRGVHFTDEDREDMRAEAQLFLLRHAIPRFRPNMGASWNTYAVHWIRAAIQQWITARSRTVRVPAPVQRVKRNPVESDAATHMGAAFCALVVAGHRLESFDEPVSEPSRGATVLLGDIVPDHKPSAEDELAAHADTVRLRAAIRELPPAMRLVVEMRLQQKTLKETGAALGGVSREWARQIEVKARRELRRLLGSRSA